MSPEGGAAASKSPQSQSFGVLLLVTLGSLTAFGPLAMDLYLPGLPDLADSLGASDSLAQVTLGACMVGLALGQLVAGPMSDRFGRRGPLLIGIAAFVVFSLACALAPTIELLIAARLLQGFAGAAGIVISMAVARDLAGAGGTANVLSILQGIAGIAPVAAPLFGGALLLVMDWHGLFVVLAVLGALLFFSALRFVPESLAPQRRSDHGVLEQLRTIGGLLAEWRFIALAFAMGLASAILFTYIQMSPLLFQGTYGLDAQQFSLLFAANSVGIVLGTQLNRMLLRRWAPRRIATVALLLSAVGSATVFVFAQFEGTFVAILIALFVVIAAMGCLMANIAAEALAVREGATGMAAAVVGAFQFLTGALVSPLASLAGTTTSVMATTMFCSAIGALVLVVAGTRGRPAAA